MGHTYIQDIRKGAVEASARYAEALDARMAAPPIAHTACTTHTRGTIELAAAVPDEYIRAILALYVRESSTAVTRTQWMCQTCRGMRVSRRACTADTARMHLTCSERRRAPSANTACPCRRICAKRRTQAGHRARGRTSSPERFSECTGGCLRLLHSPVVFVIACRTQRQRETSSGVCPVFRVSIRFGWSVCATRPLTSLRQIYNLSTAHTVRQIPSNSKQNNCCVM